MMLFCGKDMLSVLFYKFVIGYLATLGDLSVLVIR